MYSYVFYDKRKNKILCWEYENNEKVLNTFDPPLKFYILSNDQNSEYKTIFGNPAKVIECKNWFLYKQEIEKYKSKGYDLFESDVPIETKFIIEHYLGMDLKIPILDTYFLDIEVHSEDGFPNPNDADYPIRIITIWSTKEKKFFIFAEKDFNSKFLIDNNESFEKFIYSNEEILLKEFLNFIHNKHPDIISGWNSNGFDIPYIVNRCRKLFGFETNEKNQVIKDGAGLLSPVEIVYSRRVPISKYKFEERYVIVGINLLDYMEIFQNYTFSEQESWKLSYIAQKEIGESKIEYEGSLSDLYKNNWQQYVEYNIQDVRLLKKLDEKKKFLNILVSFCYGCRVPFEFFVKTTKVLDGAFLSKLAEEKIVLPDVKRKENNDSKNDEHTNKEEKEDTKYIGGYVKDPEPGLHDWVVSFDATSLYPSIMMGWNISPETKVAVIDKRYVKNLIKCIKDKSLNDDTEINIHGKIITIRKLADIILKNNYCLAANGCIYRTDKIGVIGKFVKEWFDKRKEYKKKMLKAKEEHNYEKVDEYDGLQHNYKILINSVYGYLGTPHSRLYDYDNAVAVTMTGRLITTTCIESIDAFFKSDKWIQSKFYNESNKKPIEKTVIYGDTDSLYISFSRILDSLGYNYKNKDEEVVKNFILFNIEKQNKDFFNNWTKEDKEKNEETADSLINLVSKLINQKMELLTKKYCNLPKNTIHFKREAIASKALFLNAKKHYAMWVINSEGVEIEEKNRLKLVGIEVVRSSTPQFAREYLKDLIQLILLDGNYDKVCDYLQKIFVKFNKASPDEIGFPSSVNNLEEYLIKYKKNGGFKSTPMHIRAAILYNSLIQKDENLKRKYDFIKSGDKIKFMYIIPNSLWEENVFAWKDKYPKDISLQNFIDREEQFKRSIISPISSIFSVLQWNIPNFKTHSLSELSLFL